MYDDEQVKEKSGGVRGGQSVFGKLKNFVFAKKPIAALLAATACFLIVFPTVFAVKNASAETTEIMLEINPSVLFITDKKGNVKSVKATNSDADVILSDEDILNELKGKPVSESVEIFIDNAARLGYIDLDSYENAVKITSAKDGKQTDEIVTATKKYFREKGVYSVVLKETVSVNSLAEKTGISVSGERNFKSAAKNLPELYGERNVTDMEQAYDDYIVSGLYNLVKNKISNIVDGAALILRMKVVNFEIKLYGRKGLLERGKQPVCARSCGKNGKSHCGIRRNNGRQTRYKKRVGLRQRYLRLLRTFRRHKQGDRSRRVSAKNDRVSRLFNNRYRQIQRIEIRRRSR